ncbi:MAG: DNA repair exonuclease [Rhodospirillaceae bacterium]|nr:DNA repair exonuclease [Rhodospirillales bacterium]
MSGFRFLHCADIHLDSPLRGLSAYMGAPVEEVRSATRRALENLTRLAMDEAVDFVVIAGDLYDGDWKDFQTGLFFTQQMARLGRAGIRVYMVLGNHDAAAIITKSLPRQDHVRILSTKRPESVAVDGLDVTIHGQSFATRVVSDDLAARYPAPMAGFNIGLLHTSLSGRPPHDPYAPCRLEQLVNHGYDYWALGHVHAREIVHEGPHIVFPGNLQGRNIRETGAKGATLVSVADGAVQSLEHRPLDVLRWALVSADVSECDDRTAALSCLRVALEGAVDEADGRILAARIRLTGASPAHAQLVRDRLVLREEVRAVAIDVSDAVWIEKLDLATRPALDRAALRGQDDAVGELLALLDSLSADPEAGQALLRDLTPLWDKLPPDLREELPNLAEPEAFRACLSEVEDLLVSALTEVAGA